MKKVLYFTIFTFILAVGSTVLAEAPMPVMNRLNSQMFQTEATRPLQTLERDYRTNSEILNLQQKDSVQNKQEKQDNNVLINAEQKNEDGSKLKGLFNNFVIEW